MSTSVECGNCGATLTGPYCAHCGQHAHESARSLGVLFHDAWHLLTHLDGRFWATLSTLLLKPGRLSIEYFAERRARYVPPFRLYFVLSVIFFALASLSSHVGHGDGQRGHLSAAEVAELRAELAQTGTLSAAMSERLKTVDAGMELALTNEDCERIKLRWLEATVRTACKRQVASGGQSMGHAFAEYVPKMMFVFLPLMALVMVPLYRARHYYVEHLVFFLHTHAALFLAMIVDALLGLLSAWLPWLEGPTAILGTVIFFYGVWYIYVSMRRFYGQGRATTIAKMLVISLAYSIFLGVFILGTLTLSALTS